MVKGNRRLTLPGAHGADISVDLLVRILAQADIARDDWEAD